MSVTDRLPLFDQPRARTTDPPTSHAAATHARATARAQRQRVLAILRLCGRNGATNDEIDALTEWAVGTTSRRMTELLRAGLVVRSTETRPTRRGCAASIHYIVEE